MKWGLLLLGGAALYSIYRASRPDSTAETQASPTDKPLISDTVRERRVTTGVSVIPRTPPTATAATPRVSRVEEVTRTGRGVQVAAGTDGNRTAVSSGQQPDSIFLETRRPEVRKRITEV